MIGARTIAANALVTQSVEAQMGGGSTWCAVVALAADVTAWMQMLPLRRHPASRWEP
ncbi:hypothetical protein OCAE111667_19865 [Occultella aeris]|uniref:Uncharacterized protein n=1 Tax=Occultella aeris TaxID=2761496 RepID=A0A7M4DJM6_9MICO|nr:hypothetical protein [Occultella aeris]VZO37246.1 hypothetical protein HALOF300_02333 [Occultella aeris]